MHSFEFSTDVLFAKWRAQESIVGREKSRKKSDCIERGNNQEADRGRKTARVGMMGQEQVISCVGSLVHTDQHFLQLHSESLASLRGFLNHRWRLQVQNLRHHISHWKTVTNDKVLCVTCYFVELVEGNEIKKRVTNDQVWHLYHSSFISHTTSAQLGACPYRTRVSQTTSHKCL